MSAEDPYGHVQLAGVSFIHLLPAYRQRQVVAEDDGEVVGFVEAEPDNVVRWLHVDPERRGLGVGTALFERAVSEIEDRDDEPRAITLSANTSSGAFFVLVQITPRQLRVVEQLVAALLVQERGLFQVFEVEANGEALPRRSFSQRRYHARIVHL